LHVDQHRLEIEVLARRLAPEPALSPGPCPPRSTRTRDHAGRRSGRALQQGRAPAAVRTARCATPAARPGECR
jgi:hypothetical protein